jgi:acyl-CoA synthetase (AMP-forming)/AMP-acid ligase II
LGDCDAQSRKADDVADSQSSVAALNAAWERSETFLIDPSGVTYADAGGVLDALPGSVVRDHFVLMTSGSTGAPKAIVGSKQRAEALARVLTKAQSNDDIAETIVVLPLHYSFAFVNQWLWSRVEGRRLCMTPGFAAPREVLDELRRADHAMLCLVGIQVPLLDRYFSGHRFEGIHRLHFAGGRFPQESLGRLRDFFPNAIVYNNYGCAEAMPRLTLRRADEADEASNIGRPLPGIELSTSDDGALRFRSPYSAVGFVEDGRWNAVMPDDWIATGDLGERLPSGDWRLTGRSSEVFKRHGEKISIAAVLASVSTVWHGQASCYRTRDRHDEEGFVLVLAPKPTDAEVRAVLTALRTYARAQWPLRVESRDTLPLLLNGKIDVHALEDAANDEHWHQRI